MQPWIEVTLAFVLIGALVAALVFFFRAASRWPRMIEVVSATMQQPGLASAAYRALFLPGRLTAKGRIERVAFVAELRGFLLSAAVFASAYVAMSAMT